MIQILQLYPAAELTLQAQRLQVTGDSDEEKAQGATIAKTEDTISTLIKNDEAEGTLRPVNINLLIANLDDRLKTMPSEALQAIALTCSVDLFGQRYVLLMQKEEEAKVSKVATIVDTRVVTPAEFPLTATTPKAALTVLTGLFLGLSVGIGLVFAQRAILSRLQNKEEAPRGYNSPLYALIPRRSLIESATGIFSSCPPGPFAVAFRLLKGKLYQSATGQKSQVILITLDYQRGRQDGSGDKPSEDSRR